MNNRAPSACLASMLFQLTALIVLCPLVLADASPTPEAAPIKISLKKRANNFKVDGVANLEALNAHAEYVGA